MSLSSQLLSFFVVLKGQEGNDEFVVLSTNPSLLVSLYGSLGSDTFIITPRTVEPVISKNLRGHRGIITHTVTSETDPDYDGMPVRGIQADILDNDGLFSYVSVVDQVSNMDSVPACNVPSTRSNLSSFLGWFPSHG